MLRQLLQRLAAWLLIHTTDDEWCTTLTTNDDMDYHQLHLTPHGDTIEHENSLDCCCGPVVRPGEIVYHPSLDGRDLEEQGQGVPMENPHGLLDEFDGLE